ncbi:MAG: HAD hydrolase-like protein [Candidatus Micrarchaeaceae archaeon]
MQCILFDVGHTLVKEKKEVSDYIKEAIRNIYGIEVSLPVNEYIGVPARQAIREILLKEGVEEGEINRKISDCAEEMYYSYYNLAGHDKLVEIKGGRDSIEKLAKSGTFVGIATWEPERVAKFKLEKVGLSSRLYTGGWGNEGDNAAEIIKKAEERCKEISNVDEFKLVSGSKYMIIGAKELGIKAIGVESLFSEKELLEAGASAVMRNEISAKEIERA